MFVKFRGLAAIITIATVVTLPMTINANADTVKQKYKNAYATEKVQSFIQDLNFQPAIHGKKIILNETGTKYTGPTEPFFINGIN